MVSKTTARLFFALFYLGLLFGLGGMIYARIQRFSGEIFLAPGHSEQVVVRPADAGRGIRGVERNLPADIVPFDNADAARARLDASKNYDIARLLFSLHLEEIHVLETFADRELLEITTPQGSQMIEIAAGTPLPGFNPPMAVKTIRPWSGLLFSPKGRPLAAISFREASAPWSAPAFLEANNWQHPRPDCAAQFRWFPDETSAREALPQSLPGVDAARWGVRDGTAIQWLHSFLPGAGATLADGAEVILLRFDEAHPFDNGAQPAIRVGFKRGEERSSQWFKANQPESVAPILFEYPVRADYVLFVHAWREGAAACAAFAQRQSGGNKALSEGDAWQPEGFPFELRLAQVMPTAVPVPITGAPVPEALLESAGDTVHLRHGVAQRLGAAQLRYRRTPTPPRVRYHLTARFASGEKRSFALAPGETRRVGDWQFAQSPNNPEAAQNAVLTARRSLGGPAKLTGALLFALGAIGLTITRFRR